MLHRPLLAASAIALASSFVGTGYAQPIPAVRTKNIIGTGLNYPVGVTHAPGDKCRLFVIEKRGVIKVVDIKSDPPVVIGEFLNIDPDVLGSTTANGEQGLLGIAFHPDYWENGYFFVNYTQSASPSGATVIKRFKVSSDPNVADPTSGLPLMTIVQPFVNHNGGWMDFGPDGYLYIGMGDGGSANDPQGNGQSLGTPLGKILRIDPNVAGDVPPYSIPADNPYAGGGGDPRILHYGIRNPWRNSFDRETGALYLADVGQVTREEVNYLAPGASNLNLGWRCKEGFFCTGLSGCTCTSPTLHNPFRDYVHASTTAGGFAVTGGYVYRGPAFPELDGVYFHSDYTIGNTWVLRYDPVGGTVSNLTNINTQITPSLTGTVVNTISSYGEDAVGEIYIVKQGSTTTGGIFKIVPPTGEVVFEAADLNFDGAIDGNDLSIVLGTWGDIGGDVNCDFTTDGNDLAVVLGGWAP